MSTHETSHVQFFVLHVEDEPQYVPPLETIAGEVLSNYGVKKEDIVWQVVTSRDEAIELLAEADKKRPSRGYDAVFVDLQIESSRRDKKSSDQFGLEVIRKASDYDWASPLVCISKYANKKENLDAKNFQLSDTRLDEWLLKQDNPSQEDREYLRAKLERLLVPVELFAYSLMHSKSPLIFHNPRMKKLLKELIFLGRRKYTSWPLARLLLLGEAGSGKGALSQAFYRILPIIQDRAPFVRLNCASAVSEGHGGRISFFGARRFGNQLPDQPGVFERATSYTKKSKLGIAEEGSQFVSGKAGVVFLDEFAELAPSLQASILNALEEGEIRREGDGSSVGICCHVVFATNQPVELLFPKPGESNASLGRVRHDLVDRIPDVFFVPPLAERRDEIQIIIEQLASARLDQFDPSSPPHTVSITDAGSLLIDRAVSNGWIRGVRQLQSIADVLPGETQITDGNLRSLLARVSILSDDVTGVEVEAPPLDINVLAARMGLPSWLQKNDLPGGTAWCILRVQKALDDNKQLIRITDLAFEADQRKRFAAFTEILSPPIQRKAITDKPDAVRKFRNRTFHAEGVQTGPQNPTSKQKEEREKILMEILLN